MRKTEMVGRAQTVLGAVHAECLGVTLPHEHGRPGRRFKDNLGQSDYLDKEVPSGAKVNKFFPQRITSISLFYHPQRTSAGSIQGNAKTCKAPL